MKNKMILLICFIICAVFCLGYTVILIKSNDKESRRYLKDIPYEFNQSCSFQDVRIIPGGTDTAINLLSPNSIIIFTDSKGFSRIYRAATPEEYEKYWLRDEYSTEMLQKSINESYGKGGVVSMQNINNLPDNPKYQEWLKKRNAPSFKKEDIGKTIIVPFDKLDSFNSEINKNILK